MRPSRIFYRYLRSTLWGYPRWKPIIKKSRNTWAKELKVANNGKNILLATSTGSHLAVNILDSALAAALTLRGENVHVLLCNKDMPACMACEANWYPDQAKFIVSGPRNSSCVGCFSPSARMFGDLGIDVHSYGEVLTDADKEEARSKATTIPYVDIQNYRENDVGIGEHAMAGALRYFAKGSLEDEPYGEGVLRRYLEAAILTQRSTSKLLVKLNIKVIVAHHGIYVPQGIVAETARAMGVRVVTWNPAYRKKCFIFSHDSTYHHTMMDEPVSTWEGLDLNPALRKKTETYLVGRATGKDDWIWFHKNPEFSCDQELIDLGVDPSIPIIGLLTNVIWDAQLHYRPNAFGSMTEWLIGTISYFADHTDLQLIIRIHPAERTGAIKSRDSAQAAIARAFPTLPANVFIIAPENPISTYALIPRFNAAIIYGTKTGIEITCMGKPVIVAGEAWIRGKGLTEDASSPEEYFKILDNLPYAHGLNEAAVERSIKYAFHFFFRRMIPLDFMKPLAGWPPYQLQISSLDDLRPGKSKGLDVICNGITEGTPFIYPAEREKH